MALRGLALVLGLARVGLAALGPGSCAFIEFDGQGPDNYKLVLLEPMSAGETIRVTFRKVDGSGNWVASSRDNDLIYTAPSCQLPGVTLGGVQGQTSGNAFAWPNANGQLSNSGDTLIAVSADDTPLCAASTEADTWGYVAGDQTALPAGLTANSADAITKGSVVSMCYQGVTSGTVADVKAAIADLTQLVSQFPSELCELHFARH
ncbi:Mov10 [Symbiodinium sp. CCMP2456]|nr:Mov10 [Symbiodinium sp. CCMP2456]